MDWKTAFTIFVAIVGASLFEHMVLAPRMANSPAKVLPSMTIAPETAASFVKNRFPDAVSI